MAPRSSPKSSCSTRTPPCASCAGAADSNHPSSTAAEPRQEHQSGMRVAETVETAPLAVTLLGGFAVRALDQRVAEGAWRLRRAKSLVKLLALSPARSAHREVVAGLLWPEREAIAASRNLTQVVYVARRALETIDEDGLQRLTLHDDVLTLDGNVEVDVEAFETAVAAAREQPTVAACSGALDLYAGELLPEDRYEEWTTARRESVREAYLALLVQLSGLHAEAGDEGAAIEALQRAIVEDPLHESAHRELMRRFAAGGRQQAALAQYQQLRQALRRELAAEPDPETRQVYHEILAGQAAPAPQGRARPRPAGGARGGPRAKARPRSDAGNLPYQSTSFIGRERELRELGAMLERTRLLTLTGP